MEPSRSYARRWRGVPLSINISHNRRQTEYNQVYLNCWGAKEEKNLLNDTDWHKYSYTKNDLKELHESCRWLRATGWRGESISPTNDTNWHKFIFNWLSWRGVQEWLEFYSNAGRDEVLMMLLGRNDKCIWAVLTNNSIENSDHSLSGEIG